MVDAKFLAVCLINKLYFNHNVFSTMRPVLNPLGLIIISYYNDRKREWRRDRNQPYNKTTANASKQQLL